MTSDPFANIPCTDREYAGTPLETPQEYASRTGRQTAAQVRARLDALTYDDATQAALILEEIHAGHEQAAEDLCVASGLGDLGVPDLEHLCRRYDVDFGEDLKC